jgi:hypothetical protein
MLAALIAIVLMSVVPLIVHSIARRYFAALAIATGIHVALLASVVPFAGLHSTNLVAELLRQWGRPLAPYDREQAMLWGFVLYIIGTSMLNAVVGIPFFLRREKAREAHD